MDYSKVLCCKYFIFNGAGQSGVEFKCGRRYDQI